MLKKILKLEGVKELSKNEQKNVKGGRCGNCDPLLQCCYFCNSTGCVNTSCGPCPPGHCNPCCCV